MTVSLQFSVPRAEGRYAFTWSGAKVVESHPHVSVARCLLEEPGLHRVDVRGLSPDGIPYEGSIEFDVQDIDVVDIQLSPVRLRPKHLGGEPLDLLEKEPSVAGMKLGPDGVYRLSVYRSLLASLVTHPPGFEPLLDWVVDGHVLNVGNDAELVIARKGEHVVSGGFDGLTVDVRVEAYEVDISVQQGQTDLPDRTWLTFSAVTDPPGHEDDVTWIAATAHGSVTPRFGQGGSFHVLFERTQGPGGDRLVGVMADNDRLISRGVPLSAHTGAHTWAGPQLHPSPVITEIIPETGSAGDIVTIKGAHFGYDPKELSIFGQFDEGDTDPAGSSFILGAISANDNCIQAIVDDINEPNSLRVRVVTNASNGCGNLVFPLFPSGEIDFGQGAAKCAKERDEFTATSSSYFETLSPGISLTGNCSFERYPFQLVDGDLVLSDIPSILEGQQGFIGVGLKRGARFVDIVRCPARREWFCISRDLDASTFGSALEACMNWLFGLPTPDIPCTADYNAQANTLTIGCDHSLLPDGYLVGNLVVRTCTPPCQ